jgi:hypothetical protein
MRTTVWVAVVIAAVVALFAISSYRAAAHAQSQPSGQIIPVNIDNYLQRPDSLVDVNWQKQQSIQWYSDQYEFKVTSVAPVAGDSTAPRDAFYRHFPGANDTFANSVSSTIARPEAGGHSYKVSFQLEDGQVIDPKIIIQP